MKNIFLPLLIVGGIIAYLLFKKKGVEVDASLQAGIIEPEKKPLKAVLGDVLKTVGGAAAGFIAGRVLANKKDNQVNDYAATPKLDIQQSSIPIANKTLGGSIRSNISERLRTLTTSKSSPSPTVRRFTLARTGISTAKMIQ